MLHACISAHHPESENKDAVLTLKIMLATIPAVIVGSVFHDFIAMELRSPYIIIATTIGFGLLLLAANREREDPKDEYGITLRTAMLIGIAQALAFIPGTSRSGITMTAAVMLGMSKTGAARFSFLLSIPIILASGSYESFLLFQSGESVAWGSLLLGVLFSAISAFVCIYWFLGFIQKFSFTPFVVYRLLLGAVLLVIFA